MSLRDRVWRGDPMTALASRWLSARHRWDAAQAPLVEALTILRGGHPFPVPPRPVLPGEAGVVEAARRRGRDVGILSRPSPPREGDVFDKCFRFTTADSARAMGVYPFFRPLEVSHGPEVQIGGRRVIMLGSNDYLGLTTHPRVREAAKAAVDKYGTSTAGSRLQNGTMKLHAELEERLAAFHGKEAGLVFTTGYQGSVAALSALLAGDKNGDAGVAVIDEDAHASIYDGARLGQASGGRMVRYRHGDPAALDQALSDLAAEGYRGGALVCTDGVFGAQGEIVDLPGVVAVVKKHRARLLVADAHGMGVLGRQGRGTGSHFGLAGAIDLLGGTFSKAMGSAGGWLVGERKVLDYVQHFAYGFLFAASLAPSSVAAAMAALEVVQEEPSWQARVGDNAAYMRAELGRLGFELGRSQTAVVPVFVRDDVKTVLMWKSLLDDYGVYVNPFLTPGVAPGQQSLRTSYMATHERIHLDRALDAFEKVGKKLGIIR